MVKEIAQDPGHPDSECITSTAHRFGFDKIGDIVFQTLSEYRSFLLKATTKIENTVFLGHVIGFMPVGVY